MNNQTKPLIQCALLAGAIAICSQIQIPLPMVPINLALLAVHVAGIVLKPKYAILTVLVYIALGFIGLPVFSNFSGGAQVLFGPTGGYILGYLLDAILISYGMQKLKFSLQTVLILCIIGTLGCYIFGTIWFMIITQTALPLALVYCVIPFIPGDMIKAILATLLAKRYLLSKRI
ncbi:biotin transporter BioY [Anaerorhabdus sp.]|uniref:biotin transporter BioY n=1 Tax=Anaerorhabdus sp. TaxID=1872524 RepID=UPI002FC7C553